MGPFFVYKILQEEERIKKSEGERKRGREGRIGEGDRERVTDV